MGDFNIYLIGVGGQGIGLLSEAIIRACDYAGYNVCGVDTHGLAQRGGIVESFIRIGKNIYSPLIKKSCADMVISLERNEALRGINDYLKDGGSVVYYDTVWQPLDVRLKKAKIVSDETILNECNLKKSKCYKVFNEHLEDIRMQNITLLKEILNKKLIPNVEKSHYVKALEDLLSGSTLEKNLAIINS